MMEMAKYYSCLRDNKTSTFFTWIIWKVSWFFPTTKNVFGEVNESKIKIISFDTIFPGMTAIKLLFLWESFNFHDKVNKIWKCKFGESRAKKPNFALHQISLIHWDFSPTKNNFFSSFYHTNNKRSTIKYIYNMLAHKIE